MGIPGRGGPPPGGRIPIWALGRMVGGGGESGEMLGGGAGRGAGAGAGGVTMATAGAWVSTGRGNVSGAAGTGPGAS
ncbi:MAG: hypothetical protein INF75_00655 [Roseomonas sp.]|nr:hypothetical protein [Roseomonas sp.]MCA3327345.1 hypothetical protein [Roseomonas sp.]MCA3330770.1 hypothetical protein [Roseomonas sp.]MCA3334259.1 hypothetical protein [Roseomonas sp.]MCA3354634.1 hypothetical protein [Roseomonas sp.]